MTENSSSIIPIDDKGFVYADYGTLESICKKVLDSGITKLGNIQQIALVVVKGRSLGLDLFDSLENIHVINNKTTLSGDLAMALVERSGQFEDKEHVFEGDGAFRKCTVTVTRKGRKPKSWSFSIAEAKIAGLLEKKGGSWVTFPDSMLYYRALGFALRREFPDVLRGMHLTEEFDQLPNEPIKEAMVTPKFVDQVQSSPPAKQQLGPPVIQSVPEENKSAALGATTPQERMIAFAKERGYDRDQLNEILRKLKQANSVEDLNADKVNLLIKHWNSVEKGITA